MPVSVFHKTQQMAPKPLLGHQNLVTKEGGRLNLVSGGHSLCQQPVLVCHIHKISVRFTPQKPNASIFLLQGAKHG